jgi:hypothetical protein
MSAGRATRVVPPDLRQCDALVLSGASRQVRGLRWALVGSLVVPSLTWGAFAVALYVLVAGA